MSVSVNAELQQFTLPGLVHQTLAGKGDGLASVEVWMQTIEPGGATPVHQHRCEEVVVVLRGAGRLTVAGETMDFDRDTTLTIPPGLVHQIVNTSAEPLHIIAVLSETPALVYTPDWKIIALPWQA